MIALQTKSHKMPPHELPCQKPSAQLNLRRKEAN